ncbi:LicD family protein [Paraclostridium bifermentans]
MKNKIEELIRKDKLSVLRKYQLTIVEMMKIVDKVCRDNEITYWIDSGTLLGAVRHKGFIPWDDDSDICMPRKDYNKFISIIEKELPKQIVYEYKESNTWYQSGIDIQPGFIKLYYLDKFKSFDRSLKGDFKGVFIDIFPVDSVDENMCSNVIYKYISKLTRIKHKNPSSIKDKIRNKFQNIGLENLWIRKSAYLESKGKDEFFVYGIETLFAERKYMQKKEDIYPLREIVFENYKFYAPNNTDSYLLKLYGNYMELPPVEERLPHLIDLRIE